LVYSSESGRLCSGCAQPVDQCKCGLPSSSKGDGNVRVGRESKGRKGKGVTVITGLPLDAEALSDLAKELKTHCGAGGKVRDGIIEIQGEHRDRLVIALASRGYRAKKSGG